MASKGKEETFVRAGRFVWASQDCKNINSEAIAINEHVKSERTSARESKTFLRYDYRPDAALKTIPWGESRAK